jgi:hypothetical protein
METAQKCLLLITNTTLQVPDLLSYVTNLLGLVTDLLGEILDFLGITDKMAPLLRNNALSVVLQLKQVVTPHVSKPHDYVNHMFMRL